MTHIRIFCSPDADDLFMMWALSEGHIDSKGYTFEFNTLPTDQLNLLASTDSEDFDVIAISVAHYPKIAHRFQLLPHGGSMGEGYGPVLISNAPTALEHLKGALIAIPGETTTAYHVLRLMLPDFHPVTIPIVPHDQIFSALKDQEVMAALVIHEGRLTYESRGFSLVAELGDWWDTKTQGLPLPLGANVIRRSLGTLVIEEVSSLLRESIRYGITHQEAGINWLLERNGVLNTPDSLSEYLHMYANTRTLDYGAQGRKAIQHFFSECKEKGLISSNITLDFAP